MLSRHEVENKYKCFERWALGIGEKPAFFPSPPPLLCCAIAPIKMFHKVMTDSYSQYILEKLVKIITIMKESPKDLIAVEELFIAVEISDTDNLTVIQADAVVDLAEFDLTPQETEKFQKILRKLNAKLADSFQKQFPASSVLSEIRSLSEKSHLF